MNRVRMVSVRATYVLYVRIRCSMTSISIGVMERTRIGDGPIDGPTDRRTDRRDKANPV